jgi:predicted RNA-binding protein with TRAM domain
VRAGDGVRLHLRTGRKFVVAVEGAQEGARVINELVGAV